MFWTGLVTPRAVSRRALHKWGHITAKATAKATAKVVTKAAVVGWIVASGLLAGGGAEARTPEQPGSAGTVALATLPAQAQATHRLVLSGGPFPYAKDGTVFGNRERQLPAKARGYYREYTVVTPGSADRGARRIVAGADGEMYWTADHYDSFAWIAR